MIPDTEATFEVACEYVDAEPSWSIRTYWQVIDEFPWAKPFAGDPAVQKVDVLFDDMFISIKRRWSK